MAHISDNPWFDRVMDVLSILSSMSTILMLYGISDSVAKARSLQENSSRLLTSAQLNEEDVQFVNNEYSETTRIAGGSFRES